ncbi:FAD-dependent oxidoreductase [Thermodesulfobacteriota bacterium]
MSSHIENTIKAIKEPEREIKVIREADVVVVGGGPAGVAAAVAAARNGADTVLIERYGHLGGMATGGLVILIPHMSAGTEVMEIQGTCLEMIERLNSLGAALHPPREHLGLADDGIVKKYRHFFDFTVDGRVRMSVYYDPEMLKCVLNDMIEEAGVKLYLHSWGAKAITENNSVKGVIFESKSGRQAVLGKVTIDATGDGDMIESAGADFDGAIDKNLRSSNLALVFRVGNIDADKFNDFKENEVAKWNECIEEIRKLEAYHVCLPTNRPDVRWFNNWIPNRHPLNIEDLTWVEVNVRKKMLVTLDYFKKNIPGFKDSFILDTASQLGTRGSRRLVGEHILTYDELRAGKIHEDTVAVIPPLKHNVSEEWPNGFIPYRSLVPIKMEDFLVAGRSFSSDAVTNDLLNLIPFCVALGQAAGTAAAMALDQGIKLRKVDYEALKKKLIDQGAYLPS